jgi:hypothetical protein
VTRGWFAPTSRNGSHRRGRPREPSPRHVPRSPALVRVHGQRIRHPTRQHLDRGPARRLEIRYGLARAGAGRRTGTWSGWRYRSEPPLPDRQVQTWGIARPHHPRKNETAFWPHISRRVQSFTAQMGTLSVEQVSTRNVQIIPYGRSRARACWAEVPPSPPPTTFAAGSTPRWSFATP